MDNERSQYTVSDIPKLEDRLSILALTWRSDPENRTEIKKEYHEIVFNLFSLGWDDYVELEDELLDAHMPKEYKNRNLIHKNK